MKKGTKLAALLLGLALVIPACNLPNANGNTSKEAAPSSEEAHTSESDSQPADTSEATVNYTVTISNKEALQAEWFVGDLSRKVEIAVEPKANVTQLVRDGVIQITSSNPQILAVDGQMASPVAAGQATIKVKAGESEDTVDLTLKAQQTVQEKYGVAHAGTAEDPFDNEDACKVAKHANYNNEDFYVRGVVERFYYAPGSQANGRVAYYLVPAQEGGEQFEVFGVFKDEKQTIPLTYDDIWVGGTATAHGKFTVYNNTQAETTSAVFVSCTGEKPHDPVTLEKTFAETLALGAALKDGSDSYDYIKFQGYVTKKEGNNYFLTATKGEELVTATSDEAHGSREYYSNAIELYNAGTVAELKAKLLDGAKVEVTMVVKNYHGTVENGNNLTDAAVTVIEAGQEWAIPTIQKTVTEAITVINALEDGKTTTDVYEIEGYIVKVTTAWSADNKNLSFTLGENASATSVLTVFRSAAASGTDGSALKAGDKVKVVGQLQKYVKNDSMTPEVVSAETTLLEAAAEPEFTDVTDVDAVATVKTVSEIKAMTAADNTIIAKVTGVAENNYGQARYGNFYLVDPASGAAIVIYGGYTDATFQQAKDGAYSTKTKTTAITSAIIGHTVTVYGTVGAYNNVGQLVDAKVVAGDAYTGNVAASVAVNDEAMGSAELSATTAAYGSDITINITPASGYAVKKVEVQRASTKETIEAASGVYKFKAQAKNEVLVTFESSVKELHYAAATNFENGEKYVIGVKKDSDQYMLSATVGVIAASPAATKIGDLKDLALADAWTATVTEVDGVNQVVLSAVVGGKTVYLNCSDKSTGVSIAETASGYWVLTNNSGTLTMSHSSTSRMLAGYVPSGQTDVQDFRAYTSGNTNVVLYKYSATAIAE